MKPLRPSLVTKLFVTLLGLTLLPLGLTLYVSDRALAEAAETEASRVGLGRIQDSQFLGDVLTDTVLRVCTDTALDPATKELALHPRLSDIQRDPGTLFFMLTYQLALEGRLKANSLLSNLKVQLEGSDYTTDTVDGTYPRRDTAVPDDQAMGWLPDRPLTFRYRLPGFVSDERGWIEVTLNEVYLSRQLNPEGAWGHIGIATLDGRVVSHPDKTRVGTVIDRGSPPAKPQGSRVATGADHRVLVTWSSEWSQPWLWFGEFPLETLNDGLAQRVFVVSVGLGLALASLSVSWLASRRFFRPIQELARRARVQVGDALAEGDDLQILARSLEALQTRENHLFRSLQSSRERALEAWLVTTLDGVSTSAPPQELGPSFECILVLIDGAADFERTHGDSHRTLLRVLLQAALIAFGEGSRSCHGIVRDGAVVVVVDGAADAPGLVPADLTPLAQEVKLWLGHSLTFCVGPRGEGSVGLRRSWVGASAMAERRFFEGTGQVFDGPMDERPFKPLSANQIQRVLAAVESGQEDAVTKAIDQVADHIRRHPGRGQGRTSLLQLASSLAIWMAENGLLEEKVFPDAERLFESLTTVDSLAEAAGLLRDRLWGLQRWRAQEKEAGRAHVQRILDYLWDHYREDCDVATVAREVGLSYSHLRKVFVEHVGETMVAYVNRIRVDDARHLLVTTDWPVETVAKAVGYRNSQSLLRFFHKLVGASPAEYRKTRVRVADPGARAQNRGEP